MVEANYRMMWCGAGFHQCRWGYKNVSDITNVVENYNKSQIPLDVIWNDDDHMDGAKDFTLDPINYPEYKLRPFLDRIHANGMRYVVLIDPGTESWPPSISGDHVFCLISDLFGLTSFLLHSRLVFWRLVGLKLKSEN